jgi:TolB-like protein/class 3 adenylate cyclase/AraC-like DNA-binding protein/Tfp pilus assembly protein PilF
MQEKKVRQLMAIMFTDIVGYTALMEEDESNATVLRARHREVFGKQHTLHGGEIVQYYGDGTLSVFKSAVAATLCAIDIQKLLQEGKPVPLRIGLHMGDIVFDKTEVYGDGVNFASRIESLATESSILLSGKLNDELKNHSSISTISLGHFELKNIVEPVEVFAVTNTGIKVPQPFELKGKQKAARKTIAVLPFVNISIPEDEYFSDGITEEIINALSKIKNLKVTSRTSSFFFKNKNVPLKQIAKELDVSAILEGSVRRSSDTIRITAQLIQADEDFHFWSETWDRKLQNIFEIQDEISLHIAEKLREQFGHFEIQDHLVSKQTDSIDAYGYSLKAKYYNHKWNPEDMKTAISLYEKAIELDPDHTESYLGLADCYGFLATMGFMPYQEAWGKTAQFTRKALSLNDQLPGAYYQLSNIAFFTACDYREAFKQMSKAIELKPNYVEAQQFMSFLYVIAGEKEKSREHLELSLSIDPLSQETAFFSSYFSYMMEDYEAALVKLNRCLEHNPKNTPAHSVKCYCLLMMGRCDEVIHYFDTPDLSAMWSEGDILGLTGLAYAMKKDHIQTSKYLTQLLEQAQTPEGFRAHTFLLLMYGVTGDCDKAFDWISQAVENKSPLLLFNFADPLLNLIKKDPRYAAFHKLIYQKEYMADLKGKKKVLLDADTARSYSLRLLNYIESNKPYLNPDLSLRSLAEQIEIHPNQLSWLLNESMGKNFNEFINHYRVEAFKDLLKSPQSAHITLEGLAFESGFNSKTVFNTYFKKETGLTPGQFLKLK